MMQNFWIKYNQIFDALSNRSRTLVLLAIMLIIFILWRLLFWQSVAHKDNGAEEQIKSISQEIVVLQKQIALFQDTLKTLKQHTKASTTSSISSKNQPPAQTQAQAQKITDTLKHLVIETRSNLNLTSFEAYPAKVTPLANSEQKLIEHNITIKLVGGYFSTMSYIRSIEKLNWPIYWDYLSYKVTKYPQAEITLQMHTVSIQEE